MESETINFPRKLTLDMGKCYDMRNFSRRIKDKGRQKSEKKSGGVLITSLEIPHVLLPSQQIEPNGSNSSRFKMCKFAAKFDRAYPLSLEDTK